MIANDVVRTIINLTASEVLLLGFEWGSSQSGAQQSS
jgi:hypothetical protein